MKPGKERQNMTGIRKLPSSIRPVRHRGKEMDYVLKKATGLHPFSPPFSSHAQSPQFEEKWKNEISWEKKHVIYFRSMKL